MDRQNDQPLHLLDEEVALRTILEGTATATGQQFFAALVQNLAKALNTHGAWVTEYLEKRRRLRALAFWMDGNWVNDYETDIAGTPCEQVIETSRLVHVPDKLFVLYPDDEGIKNTGAVSYLGVPLLDVDGRILGHMAVIDRRPIPDEPRIHALFRIFAARAAAELQRLRAEAEVREREEKLGRLVNSAMDAIIELDQNLRVTRINTATEKAFQCPAPRMVGQDFKRFVSEEDIGKLLRLMAELEARPEGQRYLWIPGGLRARCQEGREFPAEATLSRFQVRRETFHTLILRNINERLEAEQKIRSLTVEAELLREELQALHHFEEVIGRSQPMMIVLNDVAQVAETDATVLILGETGTGK
ncbi:MAG: PAS domain S-box protein, partial [Nitrospiraceae bacterium]